LVWWYILIGVLTLWFSFMWEPSLLKSGDPSDQHIRVLGMLLQLLGTATVFFDLTGIARDFLGRPVREVATDYLKTAFTGPAPVSGSANIMLKGVACVASGGLARITIDGQPVDVRLAQLENAVYELTQQIATQQADMKSQKDELTAEMERRVAEVKQDVGILGDRLKSSMVGNFGVLVFGVILVVFGMILTSIPVEIAGWAVKLHLYNRFW
jgi:hypothetical protein